MQVNFDGATPIDHEAACDTNTQPLCDGGGAAGRWSNYMLETVQRIGYGSFEPDQGVLISKNKPWLPGKTGTEGSQCGYNCFTWVEDAHPEDINQIDYMSPNGTPVMRTLGDYRQLDDALFHAGTNSGLSAEYVDAANNLHFYIVNKYTDAKGLQHYVLGIQNPAGAGPQTRGVALANAASQSVGGSFTTCQFSLTNSGADAATDPALHPQDETNSFHNDIYKLASSVSGDGWTAQLQNALATARFGETITVPVYVTRNAAPAKNATVTLTATSVSDSTKTATATCALAATTGDVGGSVPATLSLTLGPAASFGSFTPGAAQDYTASTTANVISTAGDALLSVADPSSNATGHLVNGAFSLPSPLQARARNSANTSTAFNNVGSSASPLNLLTWNNPISNDAVSLDFSQHVGCQRRAADRCLQQDADLHPVDDDSVRLGGLLCVLALLLAACGREEAAAPAPVKITLNVDDASLRKVGDACSGSGGYLYVRPGAAFDVIAGGRVLARGVLPAGVAVPRANKPIQGAAVEPTTCSLTWSVALPPRAQYTLRLDRGAQFSFARARRRAADGLAGVVGAGDRRAEGGSRCRERCRRCPDRCRREPSSPRRTPPPRAAPAFSFTTLDGKNVTGDALWKTRPVVVAFTASWCARCPAQQPMLNSLAAKYKDLIAFVGVAQQDKPDDLKRYALAHKVPYVMGIDEHRGVLARLHGRRATGDRGHRRRRPPAARLERRRRRSDARRGSDRHASLRRVPIRVLIADDDPVMRMLLSAVANSDPELELVAQAQDADEAIALAAQHRPDVALLDVEMPGGGGLRAAGEIKAATPATRVLALSAHDSDETRQAMLDAGADGYVVKGTPPADVARALRGD